MGCGATKQAPPMTGELKDRDGKVTAVLEQESIKSLTQFKILLLGAGESGKSTVVKQLKVIHKVKMDPLELEHIKVALHDNTWTSMKRFLDAAQQFGYEMESDQEKESAQRVRNWGFTAEQRFLSKELARDIGFLWKTPTLQKVKERRNEFWNLDASDYYFEQIDRFVEEDFVPGEEDCIMARVKTTGIASTEFQQGPINFQVVDVGGQRPERKKWMSFFSDVKAIIFVVSLAGYNQVLFEDEEVIRMHEALNLFKDITNKPIFSDMQFFLFLNKKDLFEKMIREADLNQCFPEYKGGCDVKAALDFIKNEFQKRMPESNQAKLRVYNISARFKKDVKYTWDEVTETLMERHKRDVKKASELTAQMKKEKQQEVKKSMRKDFEY